MELKFSPADQLLSVLHACMQSYSSTTATKIHLFWLLLLKYIHVPCVWFSVVHAEYNAIVNKQSADIRGSTMYVTLFPCNDCAKLIIQSKIAEVVYVEKRGKETYKIGEQMLREARVKLR